MPALPPVTVVILNWNGRHWLEQFLPSVLQSSYPALEVLVVDNASTDDSLAWLAQQYPAVRTLVLDQNYGFAEGNNRALPAVHTPYLVLLNSDVEVPPGWLEPLVAHMEAHPTCIAVQPRILAHHAKDQFEYAGAAGGFLDTLGYPFCRGRLFDTVETDQGQHQTPLPVAWATGACLMLRRAPLAETGLFDPAFFAHMEEIDFCWRAQAYGHTVWVEPRSHVYHVGGGALPQGSPRKTYLNVRNSLACLYKNLPRGQVFPRLLARLLLDGVWGLRALAGRDLGTLRAIVRGHWHFFGWLPRLRRQRRALYAAHRPALPAGWYGRSIVWQYFGRGRRTWAGLPGHQLLEKPRV